MSRKKKTILYALVAVYVAAVVAFFVHSTLQSKGGGVAYPLSADLAEKEARLTVPLEVAWIEGRPADQELVDALLASGVNAVTTADGREAVVGASLLGKPLGKLVLPEGTPIEKALWLAVLEPEVAHRRAAAPDAETIVYVTGPGEMMSFNLTLLLVVVNFLGLLVILYLLLWEPILKVLDDRAASIKNDLDTAQRNRKEATGLKGKYRQLMLGSKQERQELIAEGRKEGETERRRIVETARQEADKIIERTHEELEATADRVRGELRADIGNLSIELAEKVLSREVRAEDNRQLVEAFLSKLNEVDSSG